MRLALTICSRRSLAVLLFGVAGLCAETQVVGAQEPAPPAPRPAQGLFGGARADTAARTRLDFTASLIEGYDTDVPVSVLPTIDPFSLQSGGFFTTVDAGLTYSRRWARTQLGANASSSIRHYAELGEIRNVGHNAGVGVSVRTGRSSTLLINQGVAYSPTYLSGLFPTAAVTEPGSPALIAPDYSVGDFESYSYLTLATFSHNFTPRIVVTATSEYEYTDRLHEAVRWNDVSAYTMRGQYAWSLGRNIAWNAQVKYRSGEFGYGGGNTKEVRFDSGIAYTRRLSASRRAGFHFNIGSSATDLPQVSLDLPLSGQETVLVGEGGGEYQFGRWQARANYRRSVEYIGDLPEPVFSNGFGAGLDGFISRRVDVSALAGYASGESLLSADSLTFDTYTGSVNVRFALSRELALYTQYLYYYYDFRGRTRLLAGLPPNLERNGVRAGFTLWLPALRR